MAQSTKQKIRDIPRWWGGKPTMASVLQQTKTRVSEAATSRQGSRNKNSSGSRNIRGRFRASMEILGLK
jgi:hypothetical protein